MGITATIMNIATGQPIQKMTFGRMPKPWASFNLETGARLSKESITRSSNEFTGWSKIASELFYYNTNITVYEGDWEHFFEARFELWFHPEDGSSERKLVETTRRICGWER